MDIVQKLVVILHFIGLASLLGGFLTQMSAPTKVISPAMVHGMWTMLVTGVALAGFASMDPDEVANHSKFGIKFLILAVIIVLVLQGKKKDSVEKGTFLAIGLLSITNIAIAVMW